MCPRGRYVPAPAQLDDLPMTLQSRDDVPGLSSSAKLVHKLLDDKIAEATPSTEIIVGGFSQGGAMALYAGYLYAHPLAGIVCFSGWPALKEDFVERVRGSANYNTPVFLGHGTIDDVVLPECGEKANELLQAAGAPVTFSSYPQMAHSACRQQMHELAEWAKGVLKI